MQIIKKNSLFILIVAIPTLFAAFYYGYYASDIYVSNSAFIIHKSESSDQIKASEMSSMFSKLSGAGGGTVDYNSVVETYINSMDSLNAINNQVNIRKIVSNPKIDIFNRFNPLNLNDSNEKLLLYFRSCIDIKIDALSSIVTVAVRLFAPEDSQRVNELLIQQSEAIINSLNEQYRNDAIKNALNEINSAKKNLDRLDQELSKHRQNSSTVVDKTFVPKFQMLALERTTAESQLNSAIVSLEQAKIDIQRKKIYIERIFPPNLPDYPLFPKRIYGFFAVFSLSFILWIIIKLLVAGARDHYN